MSSNEYVHPYLKDHHNDLVTLPRLQGSDLPPLMEELEEFKRSVDRLKYIQSTRCIVAAGDSSGDYFFTHRVEDNNDPILKAVVDYYLNKSLELQKALFQTYGLRVTVEVDGVVEGILEKGRNANS